MKRIFKILPLLALTACATVNHAPPKQIANACDILDEKGKWEKPVFNAANQWGISPGTILAFMRQESGFKHDARPKDKNGKLLSSAMGYSQALDGTWKDYERERGKAKRKDFSDSADFIGWYGDKISKLTNINKADARALYLAFHEGPGGYKKGTYNNKSWLLNVADKVAGNAETYDGQLYRCEKRKMKKFQKMADK